MFKVQKRRLIRFSNYSVCITIPKKFLNQLGWQTGDEINFHMQSKNKRIILSKNSKVDKSIDGSQDVVEEKVYSNSDVPEDVTPIPEII